MINQLRKISTLILGKILKQNFKRFIWVRCNYNVISNGIGKYILITLINKKRFGNITLSWVHTNLILKFFKNLKRVEDFKVLGMNMISLSCDLNIFLKKILFFCLCFCPPNFKSWFHPWWMMRFGLGLLFLQRIAFREAHLAMFTVYSKSTSTLILFWAPWQLLPS